MQGRKHVFSAGRSKQVTRSHAFHRIRPKCLPQKLNRPFVQKTAHVTAHRSPASSREIVQCDGNTKDSHEPPNGVNKGFFSHVDTRDRVDAKEDKEQRSAISSWVPREEHDVIGPRAKEGNGRANSSSCSSRQGSHVMPRIQEVRVQAQVIQGLCDVQLFIFDRFNASFFKNAGLESFGRPAALEAK